MTATITISDSQRYARCVESSKRVHWEIEKDIIRGRRFDSAQKFLPDGLSLDGEFTTLSPREKRLVSQIQAAPTPTSSDWWSASSMPRSWN